MKLYITAALTSVLATSAFAQEQKPGPFSQGMSYQGYLTDQNGQPISDNRELEFRIYDQESGGNLLWGGKQTVALVDGNFSVVLGNGAAIAGVNRSGKEDLATVLSAPGNSNFYFSIAHAGEAEFSPRQQLLPSAFALRAKTADRVSQTSGASDFIQANFGNRTGQHLNLWGSEYGVGIQDGTIYNRSGSSFAWHKGGTHTDTALNPGDGGTLQMALGSDGFLNLYENGLNINKGPLNFSGIGQHINLSGPSYGIGVQDNRMYIRSDTSFEWFKKGTFNSQGANPGTGGTRQMSLELNGQLNLYEGGVWMPKGTLTMNQGWVDLSGSGNGINMFNSNKTWIQSDGKNRIRETGDEIVFDLKNREALKIADTYAILRGALFMPQKTKLDLGGGATRSNTDNGTISYQQFSDALDIVGAGTTVSNRKTRIYGDLQVSEKVFLLSGGGASNWSIDGNDDFQWNFQGAQKSIIDVNGKFHQISDRRLKKNIEEITDGLAIAEKLRPVAYRFKTQSENDKGLSYGFIAQEVRKLVPDVVSTEGDHLMISYDSLIPFAFSAIQEQQTQIEELQNQIKTLTAANTSFEQRLINLEKAAGNPVAAQ